jgi:Arc/MetJ family transcription regulator
MRTNIEIDDRLMAEALKISGARTKRQAVDLALQTLVRLGRQERLRGLRGMGWQGDLEAMRLDR